MFGRAALTVFHHLGLLQFFKGYDRLLSKYMRHGEGIGLDLTMVSPH